MVYNRKNLTETTLFTSTNIIYHYSIHGKRGQFDKCNNFCLIQNMFLGESHYLLSNNFMKRKYFFFILVIC